MHGIGKDFLYSAYRLIPTFADDIGNFRTAAGTGFFVKNKMGELCIVTNKHVLDPTFPKYPPNWPPNLALYSIRVTGKAKAPNGAPDLELDHIIVGEFKFSAENDIAVGINVQIAQGKGPFVIDYFVPYEFLATKHHFEDGLRPCDFVAFPGYPAWHDKKNRRPIFRAGTIASDPRYDYSFEDTVKGNCVAYEAFSYGGSSGSPVFSFRKGFPPGNGIVMSGFQEVRLVGINAGHLNTASKSSSEVDKEVGHHSGISYFFKSTAVIDMIDS